MRKRLAVTFASTLACVAAVVAAPVQAAHATYPGRDGRIAFAMLDSTGRHVYSIRPDGRGLHQLTTGPFADLCAAYSATGKNIAFCSNRSGSFEIWTMTAAGHHLRQLTNISVATFPDYSPHGGRIAFNGQVAGDPNNEVFVMNSDGSDLTQLTSGSGNNDWPAWSPDGRKLAFISDRTGIEQVYTMRPDGARQTQLTFQPIPHDQLPDWRPDGRKIAYAQGDPGVNEKIWVMNSDGTAQHQVSTGTADDFGPAWSPDGRQLAFVRDYLNGNRPVMIMNAHGGGAHPVYDPSGSVTQFVPAWQPR
jgi:Tol biopolymer transport system component